jgi:hypothetical protein
VILKLGFIELRIRLCNWCDAHVSDAMNVPNLIEELRHRANNVNLSLTNCVEVRF